VLDPSSFLPAAKRLRVGGKARVDHDCGPGSTMIVNHKPEAFTAWCFRCGEAGFVPKEPTLAERVEAMKQRTEGDRLVAFSVQPPGPANQDPQSWPKEARLWLYKAGFGNYEIQQLGFYYHEKSRRVVLPVVQDGRVVYWQARAVEKEHQPKYLGPDTDKSRVVPRYGSADHIVLTEDILSAAKVGMVSEGWSMMGTNLFPATLSAIIHSGKPVLVWLDPDEAGVRGAAKTLRALRSVGVPCANVTSKRDPKLHTRREIIDLTVPVLNQLRSSM